MGLLSKEMPRSFWHPSAQYFLLEDPKGRQWRGLSLVPKGWKVIAAPPLLSRFWALPRLEHALNEWARKEKRKVRITQVSYRELKSGPGFSHQAIEMTASVDGDELSCAAAALEVLRTRVREELEVEGPRPMPIGAEAPLDTPFNPCDFVGERPPEPEPMETGPHRPFEPVSPAAYRQRQRIGWRIRELLSVSVDDIGEAMGGLLHLADELDPMNPLADLSPPD